MQIEIHEVTVHISQATIDAVLEHDAFCSAGTKWLIRNDPNCDLERVYIEKIQDCLRLDVEQAIQGLSPDEQESFWDDVNYLNHDSDGYLDDLIDAVTGS